MLNNIDKFDSLNNYLEYLKQSGINYIPKSSFSNDTKTVKESDDIKSVQENDFEPKEKNLSDIRRNIGDCKRCKLAITRKQIVFGAGSENAELMLIGEAPGRDEDIQGEPFVGKAGQLLTKIISAIEMKREDVYISNIIKCRPPGNRNPLPDEIECCEFFLLKQIETIRPKIICALGKFAAQTLLKSDAPISTMRGRFHDFQGIALMPTYHPAYLLRNPQSKRMVWEDFKKIRDLLNGKI